MREGVDDDNYRVWHPWTRMGPFLRHRRSRPEIVAAEGAHVITREGARLLDACAGMWNVNLGHGRADVIEAITAGLTRLTFMPPIDLPSPPADRLARALLRQAPGAERVLFTTTGTAAVEGAVLLCRQHFAMIGQPRRVGVIAIDRAYHGCSLLGAALSGFAEDRRWLEPLPPAIHRISAPDGDEGARASVEGLLRLIDEVGADAIAALVFEPIMALAGVIVPPPWWIDAVLTICGEHGIKVIADEVVTGLGRAGAWFACDDPRVDAIALGKGLGGGYVPIAAVLVSGELFAPFARDDAVELKLGSTMDGCPAGCAAGLAIVEALARERLVARAAALGGRLQAALAGLVGRGVVRSIRGRGLLLGISLGAPTDLSRPLSPAEIDALVHRFVGAGALVHPAAGSTLVLAPPLTISDDEADRLAAICAEVLAGTR